MIDSHSHFLIYSPPPSLTLLLAGFPELEGGTPEELAASPGPLELGALGIEELGCIISPGELLAALDDSGALELDAGTEELTGLEELFTAELEALTEDEGTGTEELSGAFELEPTAEELAASAELEAVAEELAATTELDAAAELDAAGTLELEGKSEESAVLELAGAAELEAAGGTELETTLELDGAPEELAASAELEATTEELAAKFELEAALDELAAPILELSGALLELAFRDELAAIVPNAVPVLSAWDIPQTVQTTW